MSAGDKEVSAWVEKSKVLRSFSTPEGRIQRGRELEKCKDGRFSGREAPCGNKNGSRKREVSKRRLKERSALLVKFCYMKCNMFGVQEENEAGKDSCRQCML